MYSELKMMMMKMMMVMMMVMMMMAMPTYGAAEVYPSRKPVCVKICTKI